MIRVTNTGTSWWIKRSERCGYISVHITVMPNTAIQSDAELRELFNEIAAYLSENRVTPLREKIFGPVENRESITAARGMAYEERGPGSSRLPFTLLEGRPCIGGSLAGVQITGIIQASSSVRVETIHLDGEPIGRLFESDDGRELHLAGIAASPAATASSNFSHQADQMYRTATDLMAQLSFSWNDVTRTWIYLPELLRDYQSLNTVRKEHYERAGLQGGDGSRFPASTGIQGRRRAGEEVFLDILAIQPHSEDKMVIKPLRSSRQNEAQRYGVLFSRAKEIATRKGSTIYVSGTASINPAGESHYQNDPQGQISETLLNVAAILESGNCSLSEVTQGCLYCKDERTYATYRQMARLMGWNSLPLIPVYADVCRPELLVEVEVMAVPVQGGGLC
jgi:enamine deaminase RidA (YjgF/YER057c/UK114 family)